MAWLLLPKNQGGTKGDVKKRDPQGKGEAKRGKGKDNIDRTERQW